MQKIKISIACCTYNGEQYLLEQLLSINSQTRVPDELVICDDGSTDRTIEIVENFSLTASFPVRLYKHTGQSLGPAKNFEKAIELCLGDMIVLSDQDDVFRKDKLELLVEALDNNPCCDLAISDASLVDEMGNEIATSLWEYQKLKPKEGKPFRRLVYNNFATGCTMMFRRSLRDLALPFPNNVYMHDWWLAIVSASSNGGGICLVNDTLTKYRQHNSNTLGAQRARLFTILNVINRIKSPPQDVIENKFLIRLRNLDRLSGYLQKNFWTKDELKTINEVKLLVQGYLNDRNASLLKRIIRIPQRIRYAALRGSFLSAFSEIVFTIWPSR